MDNLKVVISRKSPQDNDIGAHNSKTLLVTPMAFLIVTISADLLTHSLTGMSSDFLHVPCIL